MSEIKRSAIKLAKKQLYPAWGAWAELTGRRYRKLLILASARSGSTLLAHILASNHQIFGMGEAKITYRSAGDFRRLVGKNLYFYWRKKRPLSGHERYVMDKLVHNHLLEPERVSLLAQQRVHTIFLLRKPGPTLKSFMRAVKVDQATALAYFVSRMETLAQYAQRLDEFFADQQRFDPGAVEQSGEAGVVAGEHDDLLAGGMELGEVGLGQAAGGALSGHGLAMTGKRNRRRQGYTGPPTNSQA